MIGCCISGGGAKIGFAVGVLEVMEEKGIRPDLAYGVSSGSLCTAALCYGDIGFLKDRLLEIRKRSDVLDKRLFRLILTPIFGGRTDGLYGMDIMRGKLDALPLEEPAIKGVVGYVDLRSGEIRYRSSGDLTRTDFLDCVQASCSIPFFMVTQRTAGKVRVDGGVRDILPLKKLIRDSLKVNEIHVIGLSPLGGNPASKPIGRDVLSVVKRSVELLTDEIYENDLKTARDVNRLLDLGVDLAGKRKIVLYEYFPAEPVCGDSLDFRREVIEAGIEKGRAVAERVLENYSPPAD